MDAHVHIWAADSPQRPWPQRRTVPHRPVPFTRDDLLREMRAAGVDAAIIVPPTWEGFRNDLGLEAARLHPDRFAVTGRLDIQDPQAKRLLRELRKQAGMLGIRLHFALPDLAPLLTEGTADWVWPAAEEAGVPIAVLPLPSHLPAMGRIAQRHPRLKLTIDHFGLHLGRKDAEAFADLELLLALAKLPNVSVKASCLPLYTVDAYPFRSIHADIRRVYDAFGPRRMFWGTDLTRLNCSYREAVTLFTEEIPWLTGEDKEWIMGRAACEWLGWTGPLSEAARSLK